MHEDERLEAVAAAVERLAAATADTVDPAIRLSGEQTWIGPAADDASAALGTARWATLEAMVALRRAAASMRVRAAQLRAARLAAEHAARLRDLATRAAAAEAGG